RAHPASPPEECPGDSRAGSGWDRPAMYRAGEPSSQSSVPPPLGSMPSAGNRDPGTSWGRFRSPGLRRIVLDDKFGTLLHIFKFVSVKIPPVTTRVDEHPAVVPGAIDPGLNRVGHVEGDRRGVRRNLAEREAFAMPGRLKSVGGDPGDHGGPG